MVYVTSDLHGCPLSVLRSLLDKANFSERDTLFILGDVIDRGLHGAELLLWITQQPNVELLLGNHEALLLACGFLFREVSDQSLEDTMTAEHMALVENWIGNGGGPTMQGFRRLLKRDPEAVEGILDYLSDCPLYEAVSVKGQEYVLVHAGLEGYDPSRDLSDYAPDALLLARPERSARYDGRMVIFGHTPTALLDPSCAGRALRTDTWICIDTGAACGGFPMLLRLDDLREFYCTQPAAPGFSAAPAP